MRHQPQSTGITHSLRPNYHTTQHRQRTLERRRTEAARRIEVLRIWKILRTDFKSESVVNLNARSSYATDDKTTEREFKTDSAEKDKTIKTRDHKCIYECFDASPLIPAQRLDFRMNGRNQTLESCAAARSGGDRNVENAVVRFRKRQVRRASDATNHDRLSGRPCVSYARSWCDSPCRAWRPVRMERTLSRNVRGDSSGRQ